MRQCVTLILALALVGTITAVGFNPAGVGAVGAVGAVGGFPGALGAFGGLPLGPVGGKFGGGHLGPLLGPFGPHGFFPGHQRRRQPKKEDEIVTCLQGFVAPGIAGGAPHKVTSGISISVTEKTSRNPHASSAFFGQFGQFPNLLGGNKGQGLEMVVEVVTDIYEKLTLILTEKGRVGEECRMENFGLGLSPESSGGKSQGFHDPFGLNPLGLFGGGHGLFPGAHGFHQGGFNGGYGKEELPAGIVLDIESKPGVKQSFEVDLDEFSNTKTLSGRGAILCLGEIGEYYNQAKCLGDIVACCGFVYDDKPRSLDEVLAHEYHH